MADKFAGGILAGSVDVTVPIVLRVKSDGAELTGKLASNVACHYWRQGGSVVTFTAATLAAVDSVHSNGGWYIINDSLMPGLYRLDLPDTAVSTGAEWVVVAVKDTAATGFAFYERFALETVHNHQLSTYISGAAISVAAGQLTAAVFGADFLTSAKVAAGAFTYDDQITTFKSELSGLNITIPNDHITSAKVAAGALSYDDQIVTFKSELSGLVITIPNDHITSAKVAAGALTYDDQITTFKSELSGLVVGLPDGHITAAKIGADAITSAKVAAGALTYDDQITTFKSELSGMATRLTTQGVRDITQYTSAQGGFPGSSPAFYDAVVWNMGMAGYKRIQTPTTYLLHGPGGTALASAPISGTSTGITIGVFTNV